MTLPAVGASTWASGSQVWNGHIGTLMAKARAKARKSQTLPEPAGQHPARDHGQVEGVHAGGGAVLEVEGEDGDQHEEGAHQRVEDELDGGVDAVGPAPDPDDEIHRDQHRLPEDVEEEEVEGHEDAEHARLEQEHGDGELFPAPLHRVPRGEQCERHEERGQQHEEQADAVHAQVIRDPERRHPRALLHELVVGGGGVEAGVERHGEHEGDAGRSGAPSP